MAFATRAQIYGIYNDLNRLQGRLGFVKTWVLGTCQQDRLPVTDTLKALIARADEYARYANDVMIKWIDITRISNELYMNSQGPGGGELERLARVNVRLALYDEYERTIQDLEATTRTIEARANSEINDLQAAPAAARAAARAVPQGPPMGGSGKPGENAAFATKEQGYEISNGLLRLHERLKDLAAQAKDARDADNLPLSDELVRLSLRAENLARRAEHDKIMYDGITGIDDGAFRANFSLAQNEGWRKGMQEMESDAADIESRIKKEIEIERARRSVVDEELQLLGSGKPGRSRGDEWHSGQNRRYV